MFSGQTGVCIQRVWAGVYQVFARPGGQSLPSKQPGRRRDAQGGGKMAGPPGGGLLRHDQILSHGGQVRG